MKRALIVTNLAGFLSFLWDDINILQSKGYEVEVATNGKLVDNKLAVEIPILKEKNIKFYQVDFDSKNPLKKSNYMALRQVKDILKNKHYDLVHVHTPISGLITRLATRKYRKKGMQVIYTSHGFTFTNVSSKKEWIKYFLPELFMSLFTDAIITINREDYANAKKMWCKNVFYIHGVGVDVNKYINTLIDSNLYRELLGIGKNKRVILSVGELSERKNHQIVIKAISKLKNKELYEYVICGHAIVFSKIKEELEGLANKYSVNVKFLGFRNDIAEINHCADLVALPSIREGLGLAGIEGLASGVPVIGSNVQGIRDYVQNGYTGYLCNPYKEETFAEAIEKYFSLSDEERMTMSQNAVEVAKKFDIRVSHFEREHIYKYILGLSKE